MPACFGALRETSDSVGNAASSASILPQPAMGSYVMAEKTILVFTHVAGLEIGFAREPREHDHSTRQVAGLAELCHGNRRVGGSDGGTERDAGAYWERSGRHGASARFPLQRRGAVVRRHHWMVDCGRAYLR